MQLLQPGERLEGRGDFAEPALGVRIGVERVPVLGHGSEECSRRCLHFSVPLLVDQSTQPLDLELYRRGVEHAPGPRRESPRKIRYLISAMPTMSAGGAYRGRIDGNARDT